MKKLLVILACVLSLVACKVELNPVINVSDLRPGPSGTYKNGPLSGPVGIDAPVLMCKQTETGLDHRTLLEAKQEVSYIFPDAEYKNCVKNSGFTDSALFTVSGNSPNIRTLIKINDTATRNYVSMDVTPAVIERIQKLSGSKIEGTEIKIRVTLRNDTKAPFRYEIFYPVFMQEGDSLTPVARGDWTLSPGGKINYILNDVLTEIFKKERAVTLLRYERDK